MYRVFCESYRNYVNLFDEDNYRIRIAEPFKLITDLTMYENEKKKDSIMYKKLCDLISFMKQNLERYPKFRCFLWTLESRNINAETYHVTDEEELEEQAKLVNSFLKLAYWY